MLNFTPKFDSEKKTLTLLAALVWFIYYLIGVYFFLDHHIQLRQCHHVGETRVGRVETWAWSSLTCPCSWATSDSSRSLSFSSWIFSLSRSSSVFFISATVRVTASSVSCLYLSISACICSRTCTSPWQPSLWQPSPLYAPENNNNSNGTSYTTQGA